MIRIDNRETERLVIVFGNKTVLLEPKTAIDEHEVHTTLRLTDKTSATTMPLDLVFNNREGLEILLGHLHDLRKEMKRKEKNEGEIK